MSHGFTKVREEPLPHLQGSYIELVHDATGARHVHISCEDDNLGFSVTFPTVPRDDTGVAHILEHCALAGSKKFPVRDPFFAMLPRSGSPRPLRYFPKRPKGVQTNLFFYE